LENQGVVVKTTTPLVFLWTIHGRFYPPAGL
jgi:hypothetical protein